MKSFRTWLRPYKTEDTPLGDLARDAFSDSEWTDNTIEGLRNTPSYPRWCREAKELLEEAVEMYNQKVEVHMPDKAYIKWAKWYFSIK